MNSSQKYIEFNQIEQYQNHLKNTDLLDLSEVQAILLKLWYHALIDYLRSHSFEAANTLYHKFQGRKNMIRINQIPHLDQPSRLLLNLTFDNCHLYKMNLNDYQDLFKRYFILILPYNRIFTACQNIKLHISYKDILHNIKNNDQVSFDYQQFAIQVVQIIGNIWEQNIGIILRRLFVALTTFSRKGKIIMLDQKKIKAFKVSDLTQPSESENNCEKEQVASKLQIPTSDDATGFPTKFVRRNQFHFTNQKFTNTDVIDLRQKRSESLRMNRSQVNQIQRSRMDCNNSFSQNYPIDDILRYRGQKCNLSAYLIQGFDIVDYTTPINQLHKQLLKKILINR